MAALVLDQQIDSSTWHALGLTLTVAGLLVSVVVWRRSGAGRGLRAVALSLLPLAAALTGLLRLAWEILDSVLRWATRLVFSPVVWLGLVVAAVAVVLYVAGAFLTRRAAKKAGAAPQGDPTASTLLPSVPDQGGRADASRRARRTKRGAVVEDQDDIEAILRKHGIS